MEYRIRVQDVDAGEIEVVVHANNPAEALVKFRHTRGDAKKAPSPNQRITILTEEIAKNMPW